MTFMEPRLLQSIGKGRNLIDPPLYVLKLYSTLKLDAFTPSLSYYTLFQCRFYLLNGPQVGT